MKSAKQIEYLQFTGIYYGYPSCCIQSFIHDYGTNTVKRTSTQLQVHENSGFIPCHNCATKILAGEITLKQLIADRICSFEFPKSKKEKE